MTLIATIVSFLHSIGIPTVETSLTVDTFLPGLTMHGGAIHYDSRLLLYPGDLLHEAGHIALTPAAARPHLTAATEFNLGDDLGAIAWSYAALTFLNLDPTVVFHDGGYRGNSPAFITNFAAGRYVGVPLLEWAGLTIEPRRGREEGRVFPHMIKWLRE